MDAEHKPEWAMLERAAGEQIIAGDWLLRLGVFPSFRGMQVIGLLREPRAMHLVWRRWSMHTDSKKLDSPVERMKHPRHLHPTIEEQRRETHAGSLIEVLSDARELSVPAFPQSHSVSLDGTSFDLLVVDHCSRSHFRWHNSGPDAWSALAQWHTRTWTQLADQLSLEKDHRPEDL